MMDCQKPIINTTDFHFCHFFLVYHFKTVIIFFFLETSADLFLLLSCFETKPYNKDYINMDIAHGKRSC